MKSRTIELRKRELLDELIRFKQITLRQKANLHSNKVVTFTLILTKKQKLKCQYLEITEELNVSYCTTSNTLLKRLSALRSDFHLEFAEDSENSNRFHISMKNLARANKQMQLAF